MKQKIQVADLDRGWEDRPALSAYMQEKFGKPRAIEVRGTGVESQAGFDAMVSGKPIPKPKLEIDGKWLDHIFAELGICRKSDEDVCTCLICGIISTLVPGRNVIASLVCHGDRHTAWYEEQYPEPLSRRTPREKPPNY